MFKRLIRRTLVVSLVLALTISSLTGCGSVADAKTVVSKHKATSAEKDTVRAKMQMDMKFGMKMKGNDSSSPSDNMNNDIANAFNMEVPISINADIVADTKMNSHTNMSMTMDSSGLSGLISMFGASSDGATGSQTQNIEMYTENGDIATVYTKKPDDSNESGWTYTKAESGQSFDVASIVKKFDMSEVADSVIANAKISEESDGYHIVVSAKDIINEETMKDMSGASSGGFSSMFSQNSDGQSEDTKKMLEKMGDYNITYIFDKETNLLKSLETDQIDISYEKSASSTPDDAQTIKPDENSGASVEVSMSLKLRIDFSDYGNVSRDEIDVPTDVKESATENIAGEVTNNVQNDDTGDNEITIAPTEDLDNESDVESIDDGIYTDETSDSSSDVSDAPEAVVPENETAEPVTESDNQ